MKPLYRFYIANDSTPLYDSSATVEDNIEYVVKDVNNTAITRVDKPGYCTITSPTAKNGLFADPKKLLTRIAFRNASAHDFREGVFDYAAASSFFINVSSKRRVIGVSARGSSADLPPIYIGHQAYPIFGDDLKKEWKKERGQAFFRQALKGKLKFVKDDYDYIMASSLGSYHCVKIERSIDSGVTWEDFFEGYFRRTDARIVPEDMLVEVQLNTLDLYEPILSGQDREFDLIKLSPEIGSLTLFKRPAIQIYTPGESVITTFVGGTYWEQECEAISDNDVLNSEYGFTKTTKDIRLAAYKTSPDTNLAHLPYAFSAYPSGNIGNNTTHLALYGPLYTVGDLWPCYVAYYTYSGYNKRLRGCVVVKGTTVNSQYGTILTDAIFYESDTDMSEDFWEFTELPQYEGSVWVAKYQTTRLFVNRVLHSNDNASSKVGLLGKTAFGENRNYKYASPLAWENFSLTYSDETSLEPTEYGQRQPGQYYKRPLAPPSAPGFYLPISKSQWGDISCWLKCGTVLEDVIDEGYRKEYTLKHAYPLHSCFSVLLKQLTPSVSFSDTPAHSEFFYNNSANLIAQAISGLSNLHITPITNILKGEYDQPAQKCTITLKDLFNLVKDLFNCYWYVDGTKLRIEHIRYFNNGLVYVGGLNSTQPDVDATCLIAPRVHKAWLLGQSEYKYELDDLPERYQFSWPDDVTEPFIGWPIEVKNDYVKKGEISEISVSKFVSDIDFMLLNPGSFNEDNIAILAPDDSGALQYLSQNLGTIGDDFYAEYSLQNGQLSFLSLVPRYYRDNISGKDVIINKVKYQNTGALNVIRTKEQVINIPFVENLTENSLVKTSLGIGRVDAMELNLNSNIVKITLKHATE